MEPGQTPVAAPGLKVNAFATGLKHPRWICVLPNGDVLVAESLTIARPREHAVRPRDDRHDEARRRRGRQPQPHHPAARRGSRRRRRNPRDVSRRTEPAVRHGAAGDTFYVGNTDGVVAFPYQAGRDAHHGAGAKAHHVQARRPLDAQPAAEPGRAKAVCRRRLAHQYRRQGHGGGRGPRGDLRARSRERRRAAFSPPACATRSAWRGSRRRPRSGRWSTSATASATKRRRTI